MSHILSPQNKTRRHWQCVADENVELHIPCLPSSRRRVNARKLKPFIKQAEYPKVLPATLDEALARGSEMQAIIGRDPRSRTLYTLWRDCDPTVAYPLAEDALRHSFHPDVPTRLFNEWQNWTGQVLSLDPPMQGRAIQPAFNTAEPNTIPDPVALRYSPEDLALLENLPCGEDGRHSIRGEM